MPVQELDAFGSAAYGRNVSNPWAGGSADVDQRDGIRTFKADRDQRLARIPGHVKNLGLRASAIAATVRIQPGSGRRVIDLRSRVGKQSPVARIKHADGASAAGSTATAAIARVALIGGDEEVPLVIYRDTVRLAVGRQRLNRQVAAAPR